MTVNQQFSNICRVRNDCFVLSGWFELITRFVSQQCYVVGICVLAAIDSLGSCQFVETGIENG